MRKAAPGGSLSIVSHLRRNAYAQPISRGEIVLTCAPRDTGQ
jgi:hypothetical protein